MYKPALYFAMICTACVTSLHAAEPPAFPGKAGKYAGKYVSHGINVDGVAVTVVSPATPRKTAAGYPWVWRAEFLGAFDGADRALLDAGWHVVYVSVANRYGDPVAMKAWEKAHAKLVADYGFMPRAAIFGFSRGGLYTLSWASSHPEGTLAVYLDNAVCDMRSWPGGKPQHLGEGKGGPAEWKEMLKVWGIRQGDNDAVLKASPLAKLERPAKGKIPFFVAYGDNDHVVPSKENSELLIAKYRELGGPVEFVVRKGADHHPHGLESVKPAGVKPVVDFVEKSLADSLAAKK